MMNVKFFNLHGNSTADILWRAVGSDAIQQC